MEGTGHGRHQHSDTPVFNMFYYCKHFAYSNAILPAHIPDGTSKRQCRGPTEHRALRIPEILGNVLRLADPESLLASWNVNSTWRASVVSIMTTKRAPNSFTEPYPCLPVECGQVLDLDVPWLEPTAEEQELFIARVEEEYAKGYTSSLFYLEGRLTQHGLLPEPIYEKLNQYCWGRFPIRGDRNYLGPRRWLDLTQLLINPYFEALFRDGSRLVHKRGKWEISLRPYTRASLDSPLFDPTQVPRGFLDLIGPMYATQPPCKALGIYYKDVCFFKLVSRMQNEDGVKVHELLHALQNAAPERRARWAKEAQRKLRHVAVAHWLDDIWMNEGVPKFTVVLTSPGKTDLSDDHLRYCDHISGGMYRNYRCSRFERQLEWVGEEALVDFGESGTGRVAVDWDEDTPN